MGPAGPAGTAATATFAFGDSARIQENISVKLAEKSLSAGNYSVSATVSDVGPAFTGFSGSFLGMGNQGDLMMQQVTECRLQDDLGNVFGGNSNAGMFTQYVRVGSELTVTGGIAVPPNTTRVVSLWCKSLFREASVGPSQMMLLRHGGFF